MGAWTTKQGVTFIVATIDKYSMKRICLTLTVALGALGSGARANDANDVAMSASWIEASVPKGFSVTAVGDIIATQPIAARIGQESPDLARLLKGSDVTVGNLEGTTVDVTGFGGYPEALSGGGWLLGPETVPADLKALGFSMLGRANNHATDWGVRGMLETDRLLDEAGIVHAGSGLSLSEARRGELLATPAARVSMISLASRYEENARAIDPLGQVPGRPGINALRTTRTILVSPERLAALADIRDAQPAGSVRQSILATDARAGTVTLFGNKYAASDAVGQGMAFTFKMNDSDRLAVLRAVRQAKQTSDFTVVSMHTHEPGNYSAEPPDFMVTFAHQAIDEGADMLVGHGPHQLRGIEIYKGKPIFYSLANFAFMDNVLQPVPRDEYEKDGTDPTKETEAEFMERRRVEGVFAESTWFESVVARSIFGADGKIVEVLLYPIELHWNDGRDADRGIPRLASKAIGQKILERLQRLSSTFGTGIDIRDGVGHIVIRPDSK